MEKAAHRPDLVDRVLTTRFGALTALIQDTPEPDLRAVVGVAILSLEPANLRAALQIGKGLRALQPDSAEPPQAYDLAKAPSDPLAALHVDIRFRSDHLPGTPGVLTGVTISRTHIEFTTIGHDGESVTLQYGTPNPETAAVKIPASFLDELGAALGAIERTKH
jgi:hypothetical protein